MKATSRPLLALLALALGLALTACAPKAPTRPHRPPVSVAPPSAPSWLGPPDLEVTVNDAVRAEIERFTGPERTAFTAALDRLGGIGMEMRRILGEYGLPQDLVFVAVIESWLSNHAVSPSDAVGAWQFLDGTAIEYGLRIDPWVDERRDPIRATRAAATYLARAYDTFHDWPLAIASYNAGMGGVARALTASSARDFWRLARSGRLRGETCRYVPRAMAAALIGRNPTAYGFAEPVKRPFAVDTVRVERATPLHIAAVLTGLPERDLAALNPHLVRKITPPDRAPYPLRVPPGLGPVLETALAAGPIAPEQWYEGHAVASGDTIYSIARDHGVSPAGIFAVNRGLTPGLQPGDVVYLPLPAPSDLQRLVRENLFADPPPHPSASPAPPAAVEPDETYGAAPDPGRPAHPRRNRIESGMAIHTVVAGDSLSELALRYDSTIDAIDETNDLAGDPIRVGDKLLVPTVRAADPSQTIRHHPIAAGETVESIAALYDVTPAELRAWNDLAPGETLRAGRRLRIVVDRD